MQLEQFLTASGVCVHARETGLLYDEVGRIIVSRASLHGVDRNLWECLRIAVDQLYIAIGLSVCDPDQRRAVEISKVGKEGEAWHLATLDNPEAIRLLEYLRLHGFRVGEEGAEPLVLLGPPHTSCNPTPIDHSQHLYVSLPRKSSPISVNGELSTLATGAGSVEAAGEAACHSMAFSRETNGTCLLALRCHDEGSGQAVFPPGGGGLVRGVIT